MYNFSKKRKNLAIVLVLSVFTAFAALSPLTAIAAATATATATDMAATSLIEAELIAPAAVATTAAVVAKPYRFTFAVGESALLKNDRYRFDINPPLLVYDKVYIELFDICALLNLEGQWRQSEEGDIVVITGVGDGDAAGSLRFNKFSRYEDLSAAKSEAFFAIDSKIYVPAEEIADFAGYGVTYDNGVMTLSPGGAEVAYTGSAFGAPDISGDEGSLYEAYGEPAAHVVNPYRAYSYENMEADARRLERMYPELIRTSCIGYSVEGRELLLIEIGRGDKEIFVCGAHHAREYISATYLMYAIDQYAYAHAAGGIWEGYDLTALFNDVKFCVVPMVNPDGVNLVQNGLSAVKDPDYVASLALAKNRYGYSSWKANINGVDINRNYDFGWTHKKASEFPRGNESFGGDEPASEPETRAVSEYILSKNFEAFVSFHAQGQAFYFVEDALRPTGADRLVSRATGFFRAYSSGDPGGTFLNFAHGHFGKAVMTVELCKYVGPYPYPDSSFDNVWRPARAILPIFAQIYSNR